MSAWRAQGWQEKGPASRGGARQRQELGTSMPPQQAALAHLGVHVGVLPHELLHPIVPAGRETGEERGLPPNVAAAAGRAAHAQQRRPLNTHTHTTAMHATPPTHHLQARLWTRARQAWLAPDCMVETVGCRQPCWREATVAVRGLQGMGGGRTAQGKPAPSRPAAAPSMSATPATPAAACATGPAVCRMRSSVSGCSTVSSSFSSSRSSSQPRKTPHL